MSNPEDKFSPDMAQCKGLNMSCIMRKTAFFICKNKGGDQLHRYCSADQRLSIYFLNPKFPASSHLLWLYSLVCVGPSWKPEGRFSSDMAHIMFFFSAVERVLCHPPIFPEPKVSISGSLGHHEGGSRGGGAQAMASQYTGITLTYPENR